VLYFLWQRQPPAAFGGKERDGKGLRRDTDTSLSASPFRLVIALEVPHIWPHLSWSLETSNGRLTHLEGHLLLLLLRLLGSRLSLN